MMKKITLLAAAFAVFSMNAQDVIWEDSFEDYAAFEITTIGDWTQIDNDGFPTFGSQDFDFDNETYVGTAIVFTPEDATPDAAGTQTTNADGVPNWVVRTGVNGLWMFAGNNAAGTNLNDDYIITPQISLDGVSNSEFTFYAKSITDQFGEEQIEVLLSTTGNEEADFTNDLGDGVIFVPVGTENDGSGYNEFTFDLSAFDGENIYIAIHYIAADSFILQMDDFAVTGETLGVDDNNISGFTQFLDANANLNLRANVALENVELFNIVGQKVVNKTLSSNNETVNLSSLSAGVYIARVNVAGQTETFKIVKR